MNKVVKSTRGVTLLEVMLVLAIAAMIIVMSVRYYQSAQQSSQANTFVNEVESIAAIAENLAANGGFAQSSMSANVAQAIPAGGFVTPWGGTISYNTTTTGFSLSGYGAPSTATCSLILAKFPSGGKFSVTPSSCTGVTYDASN